MRLSRLVPVLAALVIAIAVAAVAIAQEPLPIKLRTVPTVTPNKAGTPKKPRGVKIGVTAYIDMPADYDPPLVEMIEVWFPKGGRYNGAKHPTCSESVLNRWGPSRCPKGSIMGSGRATARADDVPTYPQITVVNGGANRVYFYTVMTNPARVQTPVVGQIRKLSGKWSYHLRARIPRTLQIVAGVPIHLQKLQVSAGRGDWLATTFCPPDRRWPYHVKVTFNTGQVIAHDGSVRCRR
jgi:hypothetical protein